MSYQRQAKNINQRLKDALRDVPPEKVETIINSMLYFGQVAKYRCRNNSAYDTFSSIVTQDIAKIGRRKPDGLDFEILEVLEVRSE